MKLAEALVERKALVTKINELSARMRANALVQEGEAPAEDPTALRGELEQAVTALGGLVMAINRTNVAARLDDGRTIAEAITERDMLQMRFTALKALADTAAFRVTARSTKSELRILATVDVAALRRDLDVLARQTRELDVRLQAANWATELLGV
jgi:uncharacterized protein DUF6847